MILLGQSFIPVIVAIRAWGDVYLDAGELAGTR